MFFKRLGPTTAGLNWKQPVTWNKPLIFPQPVSVSCWWAVENMTESIEVDRAAWRVSRWGRVENHKKADFKKHCWKLSVHTHTHAHIYLSSKVWIWQRYYTRMFNSWLFSFFLIRNMKEGVLPGEKTKWLNPSIPRQHSPAYSAGIRRKRDRNESLLWGHFILMAVRAILLHRFYLYCFILLCGVYDYVIFMFFPKEEPCQKLFAHSLHVNEKVQEEQSRYKANSNNDDG